MVLHAPGIPNIGINASNLLVNRINQVMNTSVEQLMEVGGIGDVIATSISNYFNATTNKYTIPRLIKFQLNFSISPDTVKMQLLQGKIFVFTGELSFLSRDEA
jgi:DNA ligase (NAD+)